MTTYYAFHRTWWKRTRSGLFHQAAALVPHAGRKTIIARHLSEDEARRTCETWNREHKSGTLSRRAEFKGE